MITGRAAAVTQVAGLDVLFASAQFLLLRGVLGCLLLRPTPAPRPDPPTTRPTAELRFAGP